MYDLNLNLIKDLEVDYEISYMLMNEDNVFLISDSEPIVNKYDMSFKYDVSFGQVKSEKKKHFVKDEIFAITRDKLFAKYNSTIRVMQLASGELLHKIDKIEDLANSTIYLDFNKEKYIIFNGYNQVSFYNHKGDVITSNKLRKLERKIEEFQFSRSGHFAFINYEQSVVLVI
jgi:hypothetical protein